MGGWMVILMTDYVLSTCDVLYIYPHMDIRMLLIADVVVMHHTRYKVRGILYEKGGFIFRRP